MDNLSTKEQTTFNNVTRVRALDVLLGDTVQELIDLLPASGTAANAVEAEVEFTISGVVIDGETVSLGADKYEFVTDAAKTVTTPGNIAVDIAANATKASRVLTVDTQPTSGDKMTIGTKVYTFVPVGTDTADGEISIGDDLAGAQANIVAAINGTDEFNVAHPLVTAAEFAANDCTITALVGGTVGNAIATTETFTAGTNVFAGATLAGGANCSAANANTALVAAVTASDTVGVGATLDTGVITFTADVAGVGGNAITVAKSMANATFAGAATHLAGGVNGTVAKAGKILFDASYIYIALADNALTGKNWKKAAIA